MIVRVDNGDGFYTTLNLPNNDNAKTFVESMGYQYINESIDSTGNVIVDCKTYKSYITG